MRWESCSKEEQVNKTSTLNSLKLWKCIKVDSIKLKYVIQIIQAYYMSNAETKDANNSKDQTVFKTSIFQKFGTVGVSNLDYFHLSLMLAKESNIPY